mmetsp:Transcript_23466/g.76308  ORF Transcript_23466/g.76308 Transcript_23466/m.76308 type:complete len:97 (+) Transcript_23466:474-764(+)
MEMEIQALVQDLERVAKDANTAYEEEASAGKPASTSEQVNPYLEYRNISGEDKKVDDGHTRSKIARLKAENDILRECLKQGGRGNFSAFVDMVAGR